MMMLVLEKGSFLGNVKYLHDANGATLSLTDYSNKEAEANKTHYHEHPNLYFILKGSSLEKKSGRETELSAGDLQFYYAGELHQNIRNRSSCESINLEIEFSLLDENNLTEEKIKQIVCLFPSAKLLIIKMLKEIKSNDIFSACTIQMLILQLIGQLKNEKFMNAPPNWVTQVHSILNDCWKETVSLRQLSHLLDKSPITISKYFPLYFNCTFGEYMRKLKIGRSIDFIKKGESSLTEIAYLCGFSDQSHFTRTFKEETGFLPRQYQLLCGL